VRGALDGVQTTLRDTDGKVRLCVGAGPMHRFEPPEELDAC
jgi:hypothetical protein